jgi:hypothetical protein
MPLLVAESLLDKASSLDCLVPFSWGVAPGYDGMRRWRGKTQSRNHSLETYFKELATNMDNVIVICIFVAVAALICAIVQLVRSSWLKPTMWILVMTSILLLAALLVVLWDNATLHAELNYEKNKHQTPTLPPSETPHPPSP